MRNIGDECHHRVREFYNNARGIIEGATTKRITNMAYRTLARSQRRRAAGVRHDEGGAQAG